MNITFDNVGLSVAPYALAELKHEKTSDRDFISFGLARERGSILVDTNYKTKEITIAGRITGTNQADLENNIDITKELLSREGKNLDIDYAGGTRRYKATNIIFDVDRQYFNLNYAPYSATFFVPSGVGEDIAVTNQQTTGITVASKVGSITILGTAYPMPTVKLTFSAGVAVASASLLVNGLKITYTGTIASTDVLIFDIENKKVTLNGVEKDFTGMFPQFVIGVNAWKIDVASTSHTYKCDIDYYKKYL